MKNEAHPDVLDRDMAKAAKREVILLLHPLICDLVDKGTWIIREAFTKADGKTESLALPLIAYSQFESLDALSVMCKEAICLPTELIHRSMYEAATYIRYIEMDPALFAKRSLAYMYEYNRHGRELGDKMAKLAGAKANASLSKVKNPKFKEVIEQHDLLRKERGYIHWFHLFGGPRSFTQLIKFVYPKDANTNLEDDEFTIQYTNLSHTMHSTDLYKRLSTLDGKTSVHSFRTFQDPKDFVLAYRLPITMCAASIVALLKQCDSERWRIRSKTLWVDQMLPTLSKIDAIL